MECVRGSALGRIVTVTVDRPLGSFHPQWPGLRYPVNYGFVPGIPAPDGEEQDAYILGMGRPLQRFTGPVVAIIRRRDDTEEKWVVAPEGMTFSKEEIARQVQFQEQYFQSEILP